jgi:hypothetical protein
MLARYAFNDKYEMALACSHAKEYLRSTRAGAFRLDMRFDTMRKCITARNQNSGSDPTLLTMSHMDPNAILTQEHLG